MSLLGVLCTALLGLVSPGVKDCQCSLEPDDLVISSTIGRGEQDIWVELLRLEEEPPNDALGTSAEAELAIVFLLESSTRSIGGGSSANKVVDQAGGCDQPWMERLTRKWKLAEDPARPNSMTREIEVEMWWDGRKREFSVEKMSFKPTFAENELFLVVLDEDWQSITYQSDVTLDGLPIAESSKERISSMLGAAREARP